ncbi:PH domain-containing protein [Siminovitchia sp. FSL H7-0308]|uniref:Membrane protein YdbS with pleckstrin-like domain n=1 Tax=Siminovitchia thermophila TaxID=1245522 RepID=A0ABS2RAA2_9BACI|nr:PH domain-containing protein [Siminovitchia thermophila]MBM7716560.1 membrane protein YdbS with pleckstrin-like domain [Siminovitchia thermophila]
MNNSLDLPKKRLSKDAIKVWIITEAIGNIIAFTILGILFYLDDRFSWKEWIGWILIGITVLLIIAFIWSLIEPFFLYKNWRYDVNEEFLQLKSGAINETHELIPMTKIQSVATEQGPILRKYGLYSVSVETMGSSHTIPALPKDVAVELRNQIAQYAKIKEVEQ